MLKIFVQDYRYQVQEKKTKQQIGQMQNGCYDSGIAINKALMYKVKCIRTSTQQVDKRIGQPFPDHCLLCYQAIYKKGNKNREYYIIGKQTIGSIKAIKNIRRFGQGQHYQYRYYPCYTQCCVTYRILYRLYFTAQ